MGDERFLLPEKIQKYEWTKRYIKIQEDKQNKQVEGSNEGFLFNEKIPWNKILGLLLVFSFL